MQDIFTRLRFSGLKLLDTIKRKADLGVSKRKKSRNIRQKMKKMRVKIKNKTNTNKKKLGKSKLEI